jgi:hypothetical protein
MTAAQAERAEMIGSATVASSAAGLVWREHGLD